MLIKSALDFLFPRTCLGCKTVLTVEENYLCAGCLIGLPRTRMLSSKRNPLMRILLAMEPLEFAHAGYFFGKGGVVQSMLHQIKYHHQPALARFMGVLMAGELRAMISSRDITWVPVPIHRSKLKTRGYNQSELLCEGIQSQLGGSVRADLLSCKEASTSQTKKHRFSRFEEIQNRFCLEVDSEEISKVIVVDDVFTTGATMSVMLQLLQAFNPKFLGCATFGYASY